MGHSQSVRRWLPEDKMHSLWTEKHGLLDVELCVPGVEEVDGAALE